MSLVLRIILAVITGLLLIQLGALREFVFVNVNYQLQYLYYEMDVSYAHSSFDFLNDYTYAQLYRSKWILTIAFSGLFIGLNTAFLWMIYPHRQTIKWTLLCFAFLIVAAGLIFGIGWALDAMFADGTEVNGESILDHAYAITRKIMGIVQSPIVAMVLAIGLRLLPSPAKSTTG